MSYVLLFIQICLEVLSWLVILHVVLSYFMPPEQPIRNTIDMVIEPLLAPIRSVVPLVGMFDFSPLLLLLIIQLASRLIASIRVF